MSLPIEPPYIDDSTIAAKAAALGLLLETEEQTEYLRRLDSFDVQAAPGCGKTTLTGLKLSILASQWQSSTQGVCVLSHTNIAKDQILDILRRDSDGQKFLQYPHFIGTIQGFIDTFLSLPHLRSCGVDVWSIDDEKYKRRALAAFKIQTSDVLRNMSRRRQDIVPLVETAHYVWEAQALRVYGKQHGKRSSFPHGDATESKKLYNNIKETVSNWGAFCFADMYAYGARYLWQRPELKAALSRRFPLILIDEMQDTSAMQETFLESILADGNSIIQRVGDINQKIYSGDADDETDETLRFPSKGSISLPKSLRFSQSIALAASPLTLTAGQIIVGNDQRENVPPKLLLFEEDSVLDVLPAFAKLVAEHVPEVDLRKYPVKAVGAKRSGDANRFPRKIHCYFPDYNPSTGSSLKQTDLYGTVMAIQSATKQSQKESVDLLWESCTELLIRWNVKINEKKPTVPRLKMVINQSSTDDQLKLRKACLALFTVQLEDANHWGHHVTALQKCLQQMFALDAPNDRVIKYCAHSSPADPLTLKPYCDTVVISVGNREIPIQLGTIHSCKGETHAATLVLECYHNVHDLEEVMPLVVGNDISARMAEAKSIAPAVARTFVAMTRPRSLLAFAIRKSHVDSILDDVRTARWDVIDLTQ